MWTHGVRSLGSIVFAQLQSFLFRILDAGKTDTLVIAAHHVVFNFSVLSVRDNVH